jgi:hypothetical protein
MQNDAADLQDEFGSTATPENGPQLEAPIQGVIIIDILD